MKQIDLKFLYRHLHKAGYTEPKHNHPCHELVYYLSGEGECIVGKETFSYKAGTFAYIPPKTNHSEKHYTDTEVLFFAFEIDENDLELRSNVYRDDDGMVKVLFETVETEIKQHNTYFRYAISLYIGEILLKICRLYSGNEERDLLGECLIYARDYIRAHIHQSINLQDLASTSGSSTDYFRHQFQKRFGLAPREFILQERIKGIKFMLATTDKPIKEIAERFSFEDSSHLVRVFKKETGMSPSEYRKRAKEKKETNEIDADYEDN